MGIARPPYTSTRWGALIWTKKINKRQKGFDPNFGAIEMPHIIPVQMTGPYSHKIVHLSKSYDGTASIIIIITASSTTTIII